MKKDNKGFSLVELLIAIAISSIVLMALVMLITQAVRSYTKQTALAQIQSDADISHPHSAFQSLSLSPQEYSLTSD